MSVCLQQNRFFFYFCNKQNSLFARIEEQLCDSVRGWGSRRPDHPDAQKRSKFSDFLLAVTSRFVNFDADRWIDKMSGRENPSSVVCTHWHTTFLSLLQSLAKSQSNDVWIFLIKNSKSKHRVNMHKIDHARISCWKSMSEWTRFLVNDFFKVEICVVL
jgi:hypothetical protein